jgi:hypothetical protein
MPAITMRRIFNFPVAVPLTGDSGCQLFGERPAVRATGAAPALGHGPLATALRKNGSVWLAVARAWRELSPGAPSAHLGTAETTAFSAFGSLTSEQRALTSTRNLSECNSCIRMLDMNQRRQFDTAHKFKQWRIDAPTRFGIACLQEGAPLT